MSNVRTFPTLLAAFDAYPEYKRFDMVNNTTQFYRPTAGMEPWDCPCVAIWALTDGRIAAEEY